MHQSNSSVKLKENIAGYVTKLFKEKLPKWAIYHDLWHTLETVEGCNEIGKGSGLLEQDLEILYIAAWFHDTGYIFKVIGHEEKSSELAFEFLNANNFQSDKINKVIDCIMATKITIQPKNLIESVICDADLISLGRPDYFEKNNLLKSETELRKNIKIEELQWLKRSFDFLSVHKFSTEYARKYYEHQQKMNIQKLKELIEKYN